MKERMFLHKQSGNFLTQALLGLALMVAFMPFVAQKISRRDMDAKMYAAVNQIELATTAAKIYVQENMNDINYNETILEGDEFADVLEPYGLPLGFLPVTSFGQDISLVIEKDENQISAYLKMTGGDLSEILLAEQAKRIGFYGFFEEGVLYSIVPLGEMYFDLVRLKSKNIVNSGFLTDLDMGEFGIRNINELLGRNAEVEVARIKNFSLTGLELGRDEKNEIQNLITSNAIFQSSTGEAALTINSGVLTADNVSTITISEYGSEPNVLFEDSSVFEFSSAAGRNSFYGPGIWDVRGDLISDGFSFSVERLDVSSFIDASAGQDVYIDSESLTYSSRSGIETGIIYASNITLRDQTSSGLLEGESGAVILDVRPAGTSVLPDAIVSGIDNDLIKILKNPKDDNSDTIGCDDIIESIDVGYDKNSISQYIICQYVFWRNLEERINAKQCLIQGGSDCV